MKNIFLNHIRLLLFIFYLLPIIPQPLQAQDKMETIVNRLKAFGSKIAQEQVFLHMDNSSYYLGDTIYYKAYVSRSDNGRPTDLSGVLYCELLNHDGYLVERQMIPLEKGEGHGNFSLTDTMLYAGYYELRAYTRWQLNWGAKERPHPVRSHRYFFNTDMARDYYRDYEKLYSRVFPIYDRPAAPGEYFPDMTVRPLADYHKADGTKRTLISFFPEGGNLVVGLPQRVAWEARDEEGRTISGTLTVVLPSGERLTSSTLNRGRGLMELTAPEGSPLTATFTPDKNEDGHNPVGVPEVQVRLPQAHRNGVALRVLSDSTGFTLQCHAADTAATEPLGLTILHNGTLQHYQALTSTDSIHFTPTQAGVYQVTVFNGEGRVYADRLVFFLPAQFQSENVSVDFGHEGMAGPFQKISLQLQGSPGSNLSLTVRDAAHSEYIYDTGTMLTERLLSSQIRGFVPHPQWFFLQDTPERRQALDLLLMVQGWRRYSWRQMAIPGIFTISHMPESRYPHWTGQVHNHSTSPFVDDVQQAAFEHSMQSADDAQTSDDSQSSVDSQSSGDSQASDDSQSSDDTQGFNQREAPLKYPIALRADFTQPGNDTRVDGLMKTQGTFAIDFPRFYEQFFFFLSASDTTKWKDNKPPTWIHTIRGRNDEILFPDYYVKLDPIYPRFPHPYDYYQSHLAPMPKDNPLYSTMDEQVRILSEVTVGARRGGRRNFRSWRPVMILDVYEAFNATCDAGIAPGCFRGRDQFMQDVVRTYLGDMGTDNEYEIGYRLDGRSIYGRSAYQQARQRTDSPNTPHTPIPESESFSISGGKRNQYNFPWNLDKVYLYTDFSPRNAHRRTGGNRARPRVTVDLHILPDEGIRSFYQCRRWLMKGFSIPDEFYSPDYSSQSLPREDHRRTLYWNPSVVLDEEGRATVTFYNNSSKTLLQVSVEGWTQEGVPQCGAE